MESLVAAVALGLIGVGLLIWNAIRGVETVLGRVEWQLLRLLEEARTFNWKRNQAMRDDT